MREKWDEAVYKIINEANGSPVSLDKIYEIMRDHPLVISYLLQPWKSGLQPRYECWIRQYLTKLVRERRIKRGWSGEVFNLI